MAIFRRPWSETPPADCRAGAVAIGNFDGVHRGHAALLAELRRQAGHVGGPAVALTFDPHPLQLLRPQSFQPVLTSVRNRADLLLACGADSVLILETSLDLLHLGAEEFFHKVIQTALQARALVEGQDFGFGRNREGDIELLARLCEPAGITLDIVPPLVLEGVVVSSSRVRAEIEQGNVGPAAGLLGRPYRLCGIVGTGQGRG